MWIDQALVNNAWISHLVGSELAHEPNRNTVSKAPGRAGFSDDIASLQFSLRDIL
ncbi:MAG TPA: hypothetical protein VFV71_13700 [Burkholderiales bacterium]|nr:hypothetical protein [Burkholderiales bacterium]